MAEGQVAGRLVVPVESDLNGFAAKLKQKIETEAGKIKAKIGVELKSKGLREQVETAAKKAGKGVNVEVGVEVNTKGLKGRVKAAAEAARTTVTVGVEVDRKEAKAVTEAAVGDVERAVSRRKITMRVALDKAKATAEAVAARAKLDTIFGKPVRATVKVAVNTRDLAKSYLLYRAWKQRMERDSPTITPKVNGSGLRGLTRLIRPLILVSVVSLIQPAVGAITAAIGGVLQMAASLAPAVNTLAAVPITLSAIVQSMVGGKVAFQGVSDAMGLLAEKQQTLAQGGKFSADQQKQLTAALDNVSPSAQKVLKDVVGLRDEWTKTRKAIQERFFSKIADDAKPLADVMLPLLEKGLGGTAGALGRLAHEGAQAARVPLFRLEFAQAMKQNNATLLAGGHALGFLARGMLRLQVGALPFQTRFNSYLESVGTRFDAFTKKITAKPANNGPSTLDRFLDTGIARAKKLSSITKALGSGVFGVFKAGDKTGMSLLDDFDKWANKWSDWVNGEGKKDISEWFDKTSGTVREFGLILKDSGNALFKWASDGKIEGMLHTLRTEAGPAINELLTNLGKDFGTNAIDGITEFARTLNNLEPAIGIVSDVTSVVLDLFDALNTAAEGAPGVTRPLATILGILLALKGVKGLAAAGKGVAKFLNPLSGLPGFGKGGKSGKLGGKGVVPVYVTNKGFGGPGGVGGDGTVVGGGGGGDGKKPKRRTPGRPTIVPPLSRDKPKHAGSKPKVLKTPKARAAAGVGGLAAALGLDYAINKYAGKGVKKAYNRPETQGAITGAGVGSLVGGPVGAGVGGLLGLIYGQQAGRPKPTAAQTAAMGRAAAKNGPYGGGTSLPAYQSPSIGSGFLAPAPKPRAKDSGGGGAIADMGAKITAQVNAARAALTGLPKSVATKITAPGAEVTAKQVQDLGKKYNLTPKQIKTLMEITGAGKAKSDIDGVSNAVKKVPGKKDTKIGAPGAGAASAAAASVAKAVGNIPGFRNSKLGAKDNASSVINTVARNLSRIQSKTVTLTTNVVKNVKNFVQSLPGVPSAQGNLFSSVKSFAMGGVEDRADRHPPLWAKPKAMVRVWAERETKGESYIPHANDHRRPRAKGILDRTARLFGGKVTYNATGSYTGSDGASTRGEVSRGVQDGFRRSAAKVGTAIATATVKAQKAVDPNKVAAARKQLTGLLEGYAAKRLGSAGLRDQRESVRTAVNQSAADYSNVVSIASANGGYASPQSLINQLANQLTKSRDYQTTLTALRKKGLSAAMYQQLLEAGVDVGGPLVAQLKEATSGQLAQAGLLQATITTEAAVFANQASTALYNAGVAAAKGIAKGVSSQVKTVANSGLLMADTLSGSTADGLEVRSPSRVMMRIGRHAINGLQLAVAAGAPGLYRTATSVADKLATGLTPRNLYSANRTTAATASGAAGGVNQFGPLVGELSLTAGEGGNVDEVLNKMLFALRTIRRGGVYAERVAA